MIWLVFLGFLVTSLVAYLGWRLYRVEDALAEATSRLSALEGEPDKAGSYRDAAPRSSAPAPAPTPAPTPGRQPLSGRPSHCPACGAMIASFDTSLCKGCSEYRGKPHLHFRCSCGYFDLYRTVQAI
jgi:hypothetical protein